MSEKKIIKLEDVKQIGDGLYSFFLQSISTTYRGAWSTSTTPSTPPYFSKVVVTRKK